MVNPRFWLEGRPGKPEVIDRDYWRELCARERAAGRRAQNVPGAVSFIIFDDAVLSHKRQCFPIDYPRKRYDDFINDLACIEGSQ